MKGGGMKVPGISDAEWMVMKVLWGKSPLTADDVVAALEDSTDWNPRTVKTLLNRLVRKKALGFEKQGRRYLYFPIAEEVACMRAEGRSFLERVYGGALMPMLASFLEEEVLSKEEIAELRRMLNHSGRD